MNALETFPGKCSYLNLVASEKGLSELTSKGARAVFIPRDQVKAIQVKFGSQSERPFLQLVMASVLLMVGAVGVYMDILGGLRRFYWSTGFLFFGVIGAVCLYEAIKKAHYVSVSCKSGTRKLIFRGSVNELELAKFTSEASTLGYSIGERSEK